ncbi:MAG TPA: hypothetical protein VFW65_15410 [Pseudonocardiaceae bacterium]|nr:hypothetical protein [Pseudonocardiaceae bacterium]
MTDLLDALVSPWTFLLVLVVFGAAPRLVLRLLVRIYPPGHERRLELMAELAVIPRWERPLWVVEQLETALAEGIPARRHARPGPGAISEGRQQTVRSKSTVISAGPVHIVRNREDRQCDDGPVDLGPQPGDRVPAGCG